MIKKLNAHISVDGEHPIADLVYLVNQFSLGHIEAKGHDGHCFETGTRRSNRRGRKTEVTTQGRQQIEARSMVVLAEGSPDNWPLIPECTRIVINEFGVEVLYQPMQRSHPHRFLGNGKLFGGKHIQKNTKVRRERLGICMEFIQRVLGQVQLGEQMAAG